MPKAFVRKARRESRMQQQLAQQSQVSEEEEGGHEHEQKHSSSIIQKVKKVQVNIAAGATFEVPVQVYPGCRIYWGFNTEGGDIGFGVSFSSLNASNEGKLSDQDAQRDKGTMLELAPTKRFDSHESPIQGNVGITEDGVLWLRWDNSYSWFTAKELVYSIGLDEPGADEDDNEDEDVGDDVSEHIGVDEKEDGKPQQQNKKRLSEKQKAGENEEVNQLSMSASDNSGKHYQGTQAAQAAQRKQGNNGVSPVGYGGKGRNSASNRQHNQGNSTSSHNGGGITSSATTDELHGTSAMTTAQQKKKYTSSIPRVVFVLGGPGAGKGTQCELLAKQFGFVHLSAGDLLRAERKDPESKDGELITEYIQQGKIVPVEITIRLLLKAMEASGKRNFLIDGFPRNMDNLSGWNREVGVDKAEVVGCLYLNCEQSVMEERILSRSQSGGELRDDDNTEAVRKRLQTYVNETMPIVEIFRKRGKCFEVNCDDTRESVFAKCEAILGRHFDLENDDGWIYAPSTNVKPLRVILGTMGFAGAKDPSMDGGGGASEMESFQMMKALVHSEAAAAPGVGKFEIDTASMYSQGRSEEFIGRIMDSTLAKELNFRKIISIATKANPMPGLGDNLRPESVVSQLESSLHRLRTKKVGIFYLHMPDVHTPIEATLETCQMLYERGCFKELGLSNYSAWETVHIWHICEENGWVRPTVYQGMYNAITRDVERELLPALKKLNIRFYAYNPLAGGVLTGRYGDGNVTPGQGRFDPNTKMGQMYQQRYWKDEYFKAVQVLYDACEKCDIAVADASVRWLLHHSGLRGAKKDGIIIGSRKVSHVQEALEYAAHGPLPLKIVQAFDSAWEIARPSCPKYFRP